MTSAETTSMAWSHSYSSSSLILTSPWESLMKGTFQRNNTSDITKRGGRKQNRSYGMIFLSSHHSRMFWSHISEPISSKEKQDKQVTWMSVTQMWLLHFSCCVCVVGCRVEVKSINVQLLRGTAHQFSTFSEIPWSSASMHSQDGPVTSLFKYRWKAPSWLLFT